MGKPLWEVLSRFMRKFPEAIDLIVSRQPVRCRPVRPGVSCLDMPCSVITIGTSQSNKRVLSRASAAMFVLLTAATWAGIVAANFLCGLT